MGFLGGAAPPEMAIAGSQTPASTRQATLTSCSALSPPLTCSEIAFPGEQICTLHVQTDTNVNSLHSSIKMLRIASPI